jgi:hypothetical protein
MKKHEMMEAAEQLLAGTGWLPMLLRTLEMKPEMGTGSAEGERYADAAE